MRDAMLRDTVLVIDDDPDIQDLIEMIARFHGIPILRAFDCAQGLKILKLQRFKIKMILLDYFLPGMNPAACAMAIQGIGSSIPLILLTAADDPAARAAEMRVSRWIAKPFEPSDLVSLLTEDFPAA